MAPRARIRKAGAPRDYDRARRSHEHSDATDNPHPSAPFTPQENPDGYDDNSPINHVDKFKVMCGSEILPKIIIRTGIGSQRPLHPQFQHIGDFTESVQKMCTTIEVLKLENPDQIFPAYKKAYERDDGVNTILVEYGDYYNEK